MAEPLSGANLRRTPLSHQVADLLREEIRTRMKPGDRLEAESKLCKRLQVSISTIREAFSMLNQDGMLERVQGRGTFIADPKTVRQLGVLIDMDISHPRTSYFFLRTVQRTRELLLNSGWNVRLYTGSAAPFGSPPKGITCREVIEDLEAGKIAGLVLVGTQPYGNLLVPARKNHCVIVGAQDATIHLDMEGMIRQAVQYLVDNGSTRPCLVAPWGGSYEQLFIEEACRAGIQRKAISTHCKVAYTDDGPGDEFFAKLWHDADTSPDGIFIGDDLLDTPVAVSLLKARKQVPEEVKVITHFNEGSGQNLFFPTALLSCKPDDFAQRIADLLLATLEKRVFPESERLLPFRLIPPQR